MQVQPTGQESGSRTTSEQVIPSVRGEFYSYSAVFTTERPLGYLMKCKANKNRELRFAEDHIDDLDLTFVFENSCVRVCSPNASPSVKLIQDIDIDIDIEALNETQIAPADITAETFYELRRQRDGLAVAETCRRGLARSEAVVVLTPEMIIAVTTQSGKYGLMLIKALTPESVKVDACHILL